MAYYDADLVQRITTIKEIQRTRFLPLKVIKEMIDGALEEAKDATTMEGFSLALAEIASHESITERGYCRGTPRKSWIGMSKGLIHRVKVTVNLVTRRRFNVLKDLRAGREAGISEEMLPHTSCCVLRCRGRAGSLLALFRDGIMPRAETSLLKSLNVRYG